MRVRLGWSTLAPTHACMVCHMTLIPGKYGNVDIVVVWETASQTQDYGVL